jgi:uncharacterized membrane-anchored protein
MKTRLILIITPWLILTGMIVGAYLPIYRGDKYLLPVKPRDPRDFFRGNYVDLQYEFSTLPATGIKVKLHPEREYRFGERLFLEFENRGGKLRATAISDTDSDTKAIRLKVQPRYTLTAASTNFELATGLESFFAPKEAAEDWENALHNGLVFAEVAIDAGGNARLLRLVKIPAPKPATDAEPE